ncbi:hypothetical protein ARMGADRAFT_453345 [Armillaria gallica]|uniref:Uncharacterized protein n=1 Tax=Armillaria gallica TaxID=47427 RepID=A0A2H3D8H2_ARMGA|nr:hypothetical protein ARMGADRAFT_453345 [Armillaria gallica]
MTPLPYSSPLDLLHLISEVDQAVRGNLRRLLNMPKMQTRLKGRESAISTGMMFSLWMQYIDTVSFSFFAILILGYSSRGMLFDDSRERNTSYLFSFIPSRRIAARYHWLVAVRL